MVTGFVAEVNTGNLQTAITRCREDRLARSQSTASLGPSGTLWEGVGSRTKTSGRTDNTLGSLKVGSLNVGLLESRSLVLVLPVVLILVSLSLSLSLFTSPVPRPQWSEKAICPLGVSHLQFA